MSARLIIAAPASGSGKTTITAGLIGALRMRGLTIQPFKCGPDYIDPGYHTLAAGRACRSLDTWLLPSPQVRALVRTTSIGADLALIEGVMGLFDGASAREESGSTADLARLLDAPVVLVVDARGMARSAAALVDGFHRFDPRVRIAGVLLNRVGSTRHADLCATAIADHTGLPCLGYLERRDDMRLPERHLGLVTTAEAGPWATTLAAISTTLAQTCDLDALLTIARAAPPLPTDEPATGDDSAGETVAGAYALDSAPSGERPVIAVAQDAAFSFAYPEMAELLQAAGATVTTFSPLTDAALPARTAGLILSGGFPELYAQHLSANSALKAAICAAHAAGMPIYAECGGLMYLTTELSDQQGHCWPMVGLLPGRSVMTDRVVLGYRSLRALHDGPLLPAGSLMRGHEFHYSRWQHTATAPDDRAYAPAYALQPRAAEPPGTEGAQIGNLLASYIHLHWLARPQMASRFVRLCRSWQSGESPI